MRYRFWVGVAVAAIGMVTTITELSHRAEQRALRRAAGDHSADLPARWIAPNYGESEFR